MKTLVAMLLMVIPVLAQAQECICNAVKADASEWVRNKFQGSTYVFYGKVISIAPPLPSSNETHDEPTVTVIRDFKGNFPGGPVHGAECGSGIPPGETAIFFLDGYKRIKSCSIGVTGLTKQQIKEAVAAQARQEN